MILLTIALVNDIALPPYRQKTIGWGTYFVLFDVNCRSLRFVITAHPNARKPRAEDPFAMTSVGMTISYCLTANPYLL